MLLKHREFGFICPDFSLGLSANIPDDHAMLAVGMTLYDALYTGCKHLEHERHSWYPSTIMGFR